MQWLPFGSAYYEHKEVDMMSDSSLNSSLTFYLTIRPVGYQYQCRRPPNDCQTGDMGGVVLQVRMAWMTYVFFISGVP